MSALQQDRWAGHGPLFEPPKAASRDHLGSIVSRFTSVKRQEHHPQKVAELNSSELTDEGSEDENWTTETEVARAFAIKCIAWNGGARKAKVTRLLSVTFQGTSGWIQETLSC